MFTGIIEEVGKVARVIKKEKYSRLTICADKVIADCKVGDSISVNGTCLTVVKLDFVGERKIRPYKYKKNKYDSFEVDISAETLRRTNLGELEVSDRVNLERSVRLSDRIGGHLVMGHVDEVGEVKSINSEGESRLMSFEVSPQAERYIVEKGSICVDGISLTVVDVKDNRFSVALIPYTISHTTLGEKAVGDKVNIELDIIAKYIEKLVK